MVFRHVSKISVLKPQETVQVVKDSCLLRYVSRVSGFRSAIKAVVVDRRSAPSGFSSDRCVSKTGEKLYTTHAPWKIRKWIKIPYRRRYSIKDSIMRIFGKKGGKKKKATVEVEEIRVKRRTPMEGPRADMTPVKRKPFVVPKDECLHASPKGKGSKKEKKKKINRGLYDRPLEDEVISFKDLCKCLEEETTPCENLKEKICAAVDPCVRKPKVVCGEEPEDGLKWHQKPNDEFNPCLKPWLMSEPADINPKPVIQKEPPYDWGDFNPCEAACKKKKKLRYKPDKLSGLDSICQKMLKKKKKKKKKLKCKPKCEPKSEPKCEPKPKRNFDTCERSRTCPVKADGKKQGGDTCAEFLDPWKKYEMPEPKKDETKKVDDTCADFIDPWKKYKAIAEGECHSRQCSVKLKMRKCAKKSNKCRKPKKKKEDCAKKKCSGRKGSQGTLIKCAGGTKKPSVGTTKSTTTIKNCTLIEATPSDGGAKINPTALIGYMQMNPKETAESVLPQQSATGDLLGGRNKPFSVNKGPSRKPSEVYKKALIQMGSRYARGMLKPCYRSPHYCTKSRKKVPCDLKKITKSQGTNSVANRNEPYKPSKGSSSTVGDSSAFGERGGKKRLSFWTGSLPTIYEKIETTTESIPSEKKPCKPCPWVPCVVFNSGDSDRVTKSKNDLRKFSSSKVVYDLTKVEPCADPINGGRPKKLGSSLKGSASKTTNPIGNNCTHLKEPCESTINIATSEGVQVKPQKTVPKPYRSAIPRPNSRGRNKNPGSNDGGTKKSICTLSASTIPDEKPNGEVCKGNDEPYKSNVSDENLGDEKIDRSVMMSPPKSLKPYEEPVKTKNRASATYGAVFREGVYQNPLAPYGYVPRTTAKPTDSLQKRPYSTNPLKPPTINKHKEGKSGEIDPKRDLQPQQPSNKVTKGDNKSADVVKSKSLTSHGCDRTANGSFCCLENDTDTNCDGVTTKGPMNKRETFAKPTKNCLSQLTHPKAKSEDKTFTNVKITETVPKGTISNGPREKHRSEVTKISLTYRNNINEAPTCDFKRKNGPIRDAEFLKLVAFNEGSVKNVRFGKGRVENAPLTYPGGFDVLKTHPEVFFSERNTTATGGAFKLKTSLFDGVSKFCPNIGGGGVIKDDLLGGFLLKSCNSPIVGRFVNAGVLSGVPRVKTLGDLVTVSQRDQAFFCGPVSHQNDRVGEKGLLQSYLERTSVIKQTGCVYNVFGMNPIWGYRSIHGSGWGRSKDDGSNTDDPLDLEIIDDRKEAVLYKITVRDRQDLIKPQLAIDLFDGNFKNVTNVQNPINVMDLDDITNEDLRYLDAKNLECDVTYENPKIFPIRGLGFNSTLGDFIDEEDLILCVDQGRLEKRDPERNAEHKDPLIRIEKKDPLLKEDKVDPNKKDVFEDPLKKPALLAKKRKSKGPCKTKTCPVVCNVPKPCEAERKKKEEAERLKKEECEGKKEPPVQTCKKPGPKSENKPTCPPPKKECVKRDFDNPPCLCPPKKIHPSQKKTCPKKPRRVCRRLGKKPEPKLFECDICKRFQVYEEPKPKMKPTTCVAVKCKKKPPKCRVPVLSKKRCAKKGRRKEICVACPKPKRTKPSTCTILTERKPPVEEPARCPKKCAKKKKRRKCVLYKSTAPPPKPPPDPCDEPFNPLREKRAKPKDCAPDKKKKKPKRKPKRKKKKMKKRRRRKRVVKEKCEESKICRKGKGPNIFDHSKHVEWVAVPISKGCGVEPPCGSLKKGVKPDLPKFARDSGFHRVPGGEGTMTTQQNPKMRPPRLNKKLPKSEKPKKGLAENASQIFKSICDICKKGGKKCAGLLAFVDFSGWNVNWRAHHQELTLNDGNGDDDDDDDNNRGDDPDKTATYPST